MHSGKERIHRAFSDVEKEQFVNDGFVKLENVFPSGIAEGARAILWRPLDCDPADRKTWTGPVIRLDDFAQESFRQGVNLLKDYYGTACFSGESAGWTEA